MRTVAEPTLPPEPYFLLVNADADQTRQLAAAVYTFAVPEVGVVVPMFSLESLALASVRDQSLTGLTAHEVESPRKG